MMRVLLLVFAATGTIELSSGWQYALTAPRSAPPGSEAAWREEAAPPRRRELWYRVALPSALPADAHLVFCSYASAFDVFVDQRRVYAYREDAARDRLRLHAVPVPHGRHLFVRVPRGTHLPVLGGIPLIVPREAVPQALVRAGAAPLHGQIEDVAIGAILIAIGIAAAAISRVRRSANATALLWFGLFSALYGLRLIAASYLMLLLGASTLQTEYAEAWITYLIPIPGCLMARSLLGDGWRSMLRWQVWAFTLFAPVAVVTGAVRGEPRALEWANNILVVIGGINILVNLFLTRKRHTRELRVVVAGSLVFMLFALVNNLGALGGTEIDETPGFVVFVACLGYAAVRTFTRGERERVAIEGELATAREIQRGLLPTAMPAVSGLRFSARYEPASSVAGDLFDFVAVDAAHAGIVVADVAGHGVPAALIASMVKVVVSSHARLAHDPAAMLHELNASLRRDVRRNFVTATYLWLDMRQRTVSVANGGHPPPLLIRGHEAIELGPHGVLLGRFAGARYESATVPLQAGDRIAAWTDGIVEARNARGEQFGHERLRAMLREGASADDVVDAVHRWRAERSDADDLTIVIVDVA